GVVFYEMLTGELPLGRFAPPSQKPGVDGRLDGIVFRALEREPEQRYQRISEVKTDLETLRAESGSQSPRVRVPANFDQSFDLATTTQRIGRISLALSAFAFLVLACVPVYWFIAQNNADDQEKLLVMLIPPFVYIPCGAFIAIAARRVRRHKNHTLAVVATGVGMVMALGSPLTFPIGIWVLVRLYDPKVRAMFAGGQPLGVMRGDRRRITVAETEARGSVLCLPVKLGSLSEHRYPGMLRLDGDALVLEYMKGYVRAKVKEATIQIRHIHQLRLTSGWFFDSLVLQTASLKAL